MLYCTVVTCQESAFSALENMDYHPYPLENTYNSTVYVTCITGYMFDNAMQNISTICDDTGMWSVNVSMLNCTGKYLRIVSFIEIRPFQNYSLTTMSICCTLHK